MRRPLPTHHVSKDVLRRLMSMSILIAALVTLSFDLAQAQTFGQTECDCLGNGSTDQDGQFADRIFITSGAGETWTVVSATGFFSSASPAPPAAPIPYAPGTPVPAINATTYALDGIRLPGEMWSITFSNGVDEFTRSSVHTCVNPAVAVLGDMGACVTGIETYSLGIDNTNLDNVFWTVDGGTILTGQGTGSIEVEWGDVAGAYEVSYTGQASAYDGQVSNLCDIAGSATVDVMDEEAFAIACNNQINISLNGFCDLSITADMILEDMMFTNSSYDLIFRDMATDTIVVGPMLGMEYVNTMLEVKVVHECSGNSCWGVVLLEDKSIPPLTCGDDVIIDCDELMGPEVTGFPVPIGVTVTPLGNQQYLLEDFDLCSDVTLVYGDTPISENLCEGPFSSIVRRLWVATDASGNETTCTNIISVNRASLADIEFPASFDDELGPNPSLEACGSWPKLPNGNPAPSFTGEPEGVFCLNVHVDFEDTKLAKCGDQSYKLRRKWTVSDLCANGTGPSKREFTQNITVVDRIAPVVTAPAPYTVGTGDHDCSSIIAVKPPTISDCSATSYSVSYKAVEPGVDPFFQPSNEGVVANGDGTYTITELPSHNGSVWILYYVTDACGNLTTRFTTITIEDDVQPTPVCDLHTFVAVGEDGEAYAGIDAFDDGSHDNCSIDRIEVRRMSNFACGQSVQWSDKVKFCCADIGTTVMVQLRVTDKSGNSNVCMVEAEVQDNHAPSFTFCPSDVTVDCDTNTENLTQFGTPTAEDNCNVTITETVSRNINDCGVGTITRRFTATDDFGNTDVCVQRVRVQNLDPFYINSFNPSDPSDDIVWPGNVEITNGCADDAILPENLPSGRQEPQILNEGCSRVSFTYKDVVFQYVDNACLKILRQWTVIDDCVYTQFGTQGIWSYTQTIKIQNNTPPSFVQGCAVSDLTVTQLPDCRARVEAAALATDDCTDTEDITYSYEIDFDRNGSIDRSGNGRFVNQVVEFGNHRIIWTAEDQCGNIETCTVNFGVQDDKAPTPYCISEIVTVIMSETGEVAIWASDFDAGSFDNCGDVVIASFSTNTNDRSRTIKCADLTQQTQTFTYDIYFTDPSGNSDFCTANLVIQDNQNVCGNIDGSGGTNEQGRVVLAGQVTNEYNQLMRDVAVTLNADLPEFPLAASTDVNGSYAFTDLLGDKDYEVAPASTDDYRNGVNTLDLVKIQRHILGIEPLDSPYKMIAADVSGDERISAADLLHLRKLILGVYGELPNNNSWRFVDAGYEFADVESPWPFTEVVAMDEMTADYMDADFIAVKIGDIDGSATGFVSDGDVVTTRSTVITTEEQKLAIGYNEIGFSAEDVEDIYGMQLELAINEKIVQTVEVTSDLFDITGDNVRYQDGKLYLVVGEALPADGTDRIFTVKVTTRDEAYVSDIIALNSQDIKPQLISGEDDLLEAVDFSMEVKGKATEVEHDFELFQNVPNPFSTTTDIAFVLPSDQKVSLTVLDVTGQLVYRTQGYYTKGYNVITLSMQDIEASGILHYQLDTETNSDNKKMIIIK